MTDSDEETLNKIEQITLQPEQIEVGGVEFTVHPLENTEFLNFIAQRNSDRKDNSEVMAELITMILQKDDSDITREDVDKAPPGLTLKVIEAMEQVNGLEDFFSKLETTGQTTQR